MCRLTLNIFGVIVIITVCVITAMCTNDNPQCPPGTICKKNICTKEVLCDDDSKCALDESCVGDKGTARCQYVCLGRAICGQNALCTGIHRQVCYCQPGHTGDPYVQCNPIDYCEVAPCGPGARCRNSRGSYQCTCPPDHVGNAYEEGCRISIECERNTDCGNGSECTTIDDVPKCRDVCANPKCGPNAECVPENHKANCVCRNGYEGNPADWETGCTLPMTCHVTSDCSPNTYCSDRICKPL